MEISAEPLDLPRTRTSEKWREYPADVLPLFIAEMDYPLAEPIAQALIAAVRRSDTGYVSTDGALGEAFASFAARRWGWQVSAAGVLTTTDVSVAIVETLRLAISPGDTVVITPPVYPPFFDLVREAAGQVIEVPLAASESGWALDLPAIEQAFAGGARAMVLCNPHNPLGLAHPAHHLAELADLADRHDVTVISDEVHAPLTYQDAVFTPFLSVSDAAQEHGVCVTSASKGWNVAGLKCALMVTGSERMAQLLRELPYEVHIRTSQFGRLANTAAYADGEQWLDAVIRRLDENRTLLGGLLAEQLPEVGYREPDAGYLAWLDFRTLGWGDNPSARALERARVAVNPGRTFGRQGAGFVRLNFGCSPQMLTDAIAALAAAR